MIMIKKISMRIYATLLVILILSFSVGSSYFDAYNVEAAEIGVAAAGGAAISEWLIAFLATLGLGSAAYSNRDNLVEAYSQYTLSNEIDFNQSQVLAVYDSSKLLTEYVSSDEFIDSLKNFHDTAVDQLTDLYVSLCPELLDSMSAFVQSIVSGDVYVEGLSEAVISLDGTFSDYESIQNLDGSYHVSGFSYEDLSGGAHNMGTLTVDADVSGSIPFAVLTSAGTGVLFYQFFSVSNKYSTLSCRSTIVYDSNGRQTITKAAGLGGKWSESWSINLPIFASLDDALAAFEADDFSSALNYSDVLGLDHEIIENNDLPFWDMETQALLDRVGAPDVVFGPWSLTGDYVDEQGAASDLPFIGLGDLDDYVNSLSDVIDHVFDQWLAGERDLAPDVPDTYGDLYDSAISDAWDDVISDSYPGVRDPAQPDVVVPGERPGVLDPDRPVVDDPANSIDDVLADAIDIADPVPGLVDDFSGFGLSLKDKFPFCIPWDIYYLLTKLSEAPKTPVFKLPLYLPRYGIHEDIVIDLSPFESVSKLSRAFLSLLFAFGLIKLTISFIGMIDDNVTT